jgi:hypothetical protein
LKLFGRHGRGRVICFQKAFDKGFPKNMTCPFFPSKQNYLIAIE